MEARSLSLSGAPQHRDTFRLDGKVAIITGAASGIGRAIARRFAQQGASVRILDIDEKAGNTAAQEIAASGGDAKACACDVSDQSSAKEVCNKLARQGRLDILVNNAGVSHIGTVETTTEADFDRLFRINVKGVYNCNVRRDRAHEIPGRRRDSEYGLHCRNRGACRSLCVFHEQRRGRGHDLLRG